LKKTKNFYLYREKHLDCIDLMVSLKSHSLWNIIGTGLPMLVGLVSIPILIKAIGVEAFGLLTLIWTLIGYFSLFDFGLGRALTQQISRARDLNRDQLTQLAASGLFATLVLGIIGGLVLYFASRLMIFHFLNISNEIQADALMAMQLAALAIPLVTLTSAYRGILEGFEDFKMSNIWRLLLGMLNFVLPVIIVLVYRANIIPVVWSLIVSRLLVMLLHTITIRKHLKHIHNRLNISYSLLRRLFNFGFWMTLSNIIGPLMVVADRFFISAFIGVNIVAYYTVPQDFVLRLLILPAAISSALFPRLAYLHASKDDTTTVRLMTKSLRTIALFMGFVSLSLALGSKIGLSLWLGEDFAAEAWPVLSILSVGIFFNSMAHVPFAALQAVGKVRTTSLIHIFEAMIYFPVLLLLLHLYGIIGVAIAWSLRTFADFIILQYFVQQNNKSYAVVSK